jgi:hypothetical protein
MIYFDSDMSKSTNTVVYSLLFVSKSVDLDFRLSKIFIEVPNFVVYKYI